MKDWRIKLDFTMAVSLALTAAVALCSCKTKAVDNEAVETVRQPSTAVVTEEASKAEQEPVFDEHPVTVDKMPIIRTEVVTLYDVPLDEDLQLHIIKLAKEYGIDPAIIFAIAHRESNYKSDVVGDSGASLGLMQVQPHWHGERMERLGCTDLFDPYQNVTVAIDYLVELLTRYQTIDKALTAYNKGHYDGIVTEYAVAVLNLAEEVRSTKYQKEVSK